MFKKKILFLIIVLCSFCYPVLADSIHVCLNFRPNVNTEGNSRIGVRHPRCPMKSRYILLNGYHVFIPEEMLGHSMILTDGLSSSVYDVIINTTEIDLPDWLKGTYRIIFMPLDDETYVYEGVITL